MARGTNLAALAVALAALAVSDLAQALSCDADITRAPLAGATQVPTNVVLWGYGRNSFERLLGPSGEVVPVERRSVPVAIDYRDSPTSAYPVLVPTQPLAPDTQYTIEYDGYAPAPDAEPSIRQAVFTTGSGPSVVAPPVPVFRSAEPRVGRSWDGGVARSIRLEFAHQGLLIADMGGLGAVTSIDDMFLEDTSLAPYAPVEGSGIDWVTKEQVFGVGYSDCGGYWPSDTDYLNMRLGVLDLAGNFSGWVDVELQRPSLEEAEAAVAANDAAAYKRTFGPRDGRPPACAVTPAAAGGIGAWLTLALAGALAFGRRLRRPRG